MYEDYLTHSPVDDDHRLLTLAANETDTAIVITDPFGATVYVNDGFTRMLGYTLAQMRGKLPSAVVRGAYTDAQALLELREQVVAGKSFRAEVLVYDHCKKPLWISAVVNPVKNEHGDCTSLVGVWTDITHTKIHEVLQHKVLRAIAHEYPLRNVVELICLEVEQIAPEVRVSIRRLDSDERLWSLGAPNLPKAFVTALDGANMDNVAETSTVPKFKGQLVSFTGEEHVKLWGHSGALAQAYDIDTCWWHVIRSSTGAALGTLAFYYRDASIPNSLHRRLAEVSLNLCSLALEREASKEQIRRLAYYDTLTDLPNRAALLSRANHLLAEATRIGRSLAVLFVDVDRFKQVNDSFGHCAGDSLLIEVARRLESCRAEHDYVCRLSGDEFVVVLASCDAELAAVQGISIMAQLAKPMRLAGMSVTATASVGAAIFPQHGGDIETLLLHADMAMYRSKKAGRNRYTLFEPRLCQVAQENSKLERALREALRNGGVDLHYQPQIRLADKGLYGLEALARWCDATSGMVAPQRFVTLAEEGGFIAELDHYVIRRACIQLHEWRLQGIDVPHISVNVSPTTFRDKSIAELIESSLRECDLQPLDLVVEITEGVMLEADSDSIVNLRAVHDLGVDLSIDDFGTGYSSLSYLHRMPFDELKLDKSFVQALGSESGATALATAVIKIGASMNMTVVAEGIETEQQREMLRVQGCTVGQGYLFAKPMSAEEFVAWGLARK
jgi:diguanylate cyclase (GGDEF)-like protein/PAS domain S-box-containing protein